MLMSGGGEGKGEGDGDGDENENGKERRDGDIHNQFHEINTILARKSIKNPKTGLSFAILK
jgi:hypothetical protein